jgi:hypothetical protein
MPAPDTPKPRPLITPVGILLLTVFCAAMVGVALSTQPVIKRLDAPPPGTVLVFSGKENSLILKLAEKSIKGLHHAVGVRGRLDVPGEAAPRPLLARSLNSADWDTKIKTPQFGPTAKPGALESHITLLLAASIPDNPQLYGRSLAATFDLDMIVPRLNPDNPKVGQSVPLRVTRTLQLQIQPPDFRRIYQRLNFISLLVAGGVAVLTLLRQCFRQKRAAA